PVEVRIPDWPYDSLDLILFAEAAAAFEEFTLSGKLNQLKVQTYDAWPNIFRQSRFLSAVDFVQTDRFRNQVANEMARVFSEVDLLLVPSLRDEMLTISNFTGHPSLTFRAGFVEVSEARSDWAPDPANPLPKFSPPRRVPHGVTLIGRLFDEGTLGRAGLTAQDGGQPLALLGTRRVVAGRDRLHNFSLQSRGCGKLLHSDPGLFHVARDRLHFARLVTVRITLRAVRNRPTFMESRQLD